MEEDFTDDDSITMEEGTTAVNPDPLNLFRSNISVNGSFKGSVKNDTASTPLSANTRKRRNLQKKKAGEKVKNQDIDNFLLSSTFQNIVNEEFPMEPIPDGRKPKIVRTPKVKETITWKAKEPNVNDKPPTPPREKNSPTSHRMN